jgi:hypothetical protein
VLRQRAKRLKLKCVFNLNKTNSGEFMKTVPLFLTAMMILATVVSSAAPSVASTMGDHKSLSVHKLVDQYYLKKDQRHYTPMNCPPNNRQSCVDAACDQLGSFGCNEITEIQEVGKACRGNYDGHCLKVICERLGPFDCNELSEIQKVARACVGNYDTSCLDSVCERLGPFGCDEISEVQEVLKTCAGN